MGGEARRFCENETGMAKEASGSEERREREDSREEERGREGGGLGIRLGSSFLRMMKWPSCYP